MFFSELKSFKSVEGGPIKAYKTEKKSAKYNYFLAGVHGDEVEGVYVLERLFQILDHHTELEIPAIVIPILNVDGYRAQRRTNSHGVDLNRNLPTKDWSADYTEAKYHPGPNALSEPENQFLQKLFDKYPPNLCISFHSWKALINYNGDHRAYELAKFLSEMNQYKAVSDVGYPTPGSLGTYLPEVYQAPVITFECPRLSETVSLKDIWEENASALESLLTHELLQV